MIRVLADQHISLIGESSRTPLVQLETEKAMVIELQKEMSGLKLAISDCDSTIKVMGEELKVSKELKEHMSELMCEMFFEKVADQSIYNHQIDEYLSEISQLKSTLEERIVIWNAVTRKLQKQVDENQESIDELNKKLNVLKLEKEGVSSELNTLKSEKLFDDIISREKLIDLSKNLQSLTNENTKLKHEIVTADREAEVVQKQVADLKLVNETMGDELQASRKKVLEREDEISKLNLDLPSKVLEQTHWLEYQLRSSKQELASLQEQLYREKDKNLGLQKKISLYVDDDQIMDEVNSQIDTLRAEKCSGQFYSRFEFSPTCACGRCAT